jgi:hypothetical protein
LETGDDAAALTALAVRAVVVEVWLAGEFADPPTVFDRAEGAAAAAVDGEGFATCWSPSPDRA